MTAEDARLLPSRRRRREAPKKVAMEFATLERRIKSTFPTLSPQLQRAATYVLEQPDDVALISMRGLAAAADVHPSNMVRLAQALGFAGYQSFREPFEHRMRGDTRRYVTGAEKLQERGADGEASALLEEVIASGEANLRGTLAINNEAAIVAAAQALRAAPRVFVMGMRSCFPVAYLFHYLRRMFMRGTFLVGSPGSTFGDDLRDFGPDDLLFAVSLAPYTLETVHAVEQAKDRQGTVVALTDLPGSPLAKTADHALFVPQEGPSFFGSVAAAVTVVEALTVLMVAEGGDEALQAIAVSEGQLLRSNAYWHGGHRGRRRGAADSDQEE